MRILKASDLVPFGGNGCRSEGTVSLEHGSSRPLPSELGNESSANFKDGAGFLGGIVAQVRDKRDNEVRFEGGEDFRRHDGFCHPRCGKRGDGVDADVLPLPLAGKSVGETEQGKFG